MDCYLVLAGPKSGRVEAEIFPAQRNKLLELTDRQRSALMLLR
jgi:hypothetical protein